MPTITTREYNPDSGSLLGNVTTLDFGKISAGTTSRVKVMDIAFGEVSSIGNVKLGLVSSGGLVVNTNPSDVNADGSAGNGNFGVESSADFNGTKTTAPLSRHFTGVNADGSSGNTNNVDVGNRSTTLSNYIYLDIEIGSANITAGNGAYKVFFDYS